MPIKSVEWAVWSLYLLCSWSNIRSSLPRSNTLTSLLNSFVYNSCCQNPNSVAWRRSKRLAAHTWLQRGWMWPLDQSTRRCKFELLCSVLNYNSHKDYTGLSLIRPIVGPACGAESLICASCLRVSGQGVVSTEICALIVPCSYSEGPRPAVHAHWNNGGVCVCFGGEAWRHQQTFL